MKKEKFSLGRLKKIPRNQLLIGGLAGILLLVIAIPSEKKADIGKGQEQGQEQDAGQDSYEGKTHSLETGIVEQCISMSYNEKHGK